MRAEMAVDLGLDPVKACSSTRLTRDDLAGGDFVGARRAAEHRVAMREAAEALDDVMMLLGEAEQ